MVCIFYCVEFLTSIYQEVSFIKKIEKTIPSSASKFAHPDSWKRAQSELNNSELLCHRPANRYGTHVSLHVKAFDNFLTNCQEVQIDIKDSTLVHCLASSCSDGFEDEESKVDNFVRWLRMYLNQQLVQRTYQTRSKKPCCCDVCVMYQFKGDAFDLLIAEFKNETHGNSSDAYMQLVSYYLFNLTNVKGAAIQFCKCPCFLMEICGCYFTIYGALQDGESILIDPLVTSSFLYRNNDKPSVVRLARMFKALKLGLEDLKTYYSFQLNNESNEASLLKFPFSCDCNGLEFSYIKRIHKEVYLAHAKVENKAVVVKFVEQYGTEAHKLCAEYGYAPNLIAGPVKVTSRYSIIVMEYLENAVTLYEFYKGHTDLKKDLYQGCCRILKALHDNNFCHGDFRSSNILVLPPNNTVYVVDFDWAGKKDTSCYPTFMNHLQLTWPPMAKDGKPLCCDHDNYWLEKNFNDDAIRNEPVDKIITEIFDN